jgi:hypothetical protein
MKHKNLFLLPILLIITISMNSCTNTTGPDKTPVLRITETPLITGFYVTKVDHPDGTGEVIGKPSYKVNKINVFPNPCPEYPIQYIEYNQILITFSYLPRKVTIIIVRGRSKDDVNYGAVSSFGVPNTPTGIWKARTLVKDDPSPFWKWDARDENRAYVPKGYYRAYFFGDGVPDNYFLDMSIDPTPYLNIIYNY